MLFDRAFYNWYNFVYQAFKTGKIYRDIFITEIESELFEQVLASGLLTLASR